MSESVVRMRGLGALSKVPTHRHGKRFFVDAKVLFLMHFESETDVLETLKHLEVWPALLPQHLDA